MRAAQMGQGGRRRRRCACPRHAPLPRHPLASPRPHPTRPGFRDFPLGDLPMLEVLRQASEGVFVPLTVGGGIREFTDAGGRHYSALEVAAEYFRWAQGRGGGSGAALRGSLGTGPRWKRRPSTSGGVGAPAWKAGWQGRGCSSDVLAGCAGARGRGALQAARSPALPAAHPRATRPPPPAPPHPARRSGADKVSIGSDAVEAVEAYLARGGAKDGSTAIEQISRVYGAQVRRRRCRTSALFWGPVVALLEHAAILPGAPAGPAGWPAGRARRGAAGAGGGGGRRASPPRCHSRMRPPTRPSDPLTPTAGGGGVHRPQARVGVRPRLHHPPLRQGQQAG